MQDRGLINLCIKKDAIAWGVFVKKYSGLVYWAIEDRLKKWDYLYHRDDIDEIYQTIFLNLWDKNKLEQVRDHKKIPGWLVIISGNEAIDYFRYQKAQSPPHAISIFEEIVYKNKVISIADLLPAKNENGISKTKEEESQLIINKALSALSDRDMIILKLSVLYKKKYREIAKMLHMPIGSVATALRSIKANLKRQLKGKI